MNRGIKYDRSYRGKMSRVAGGHFENFIEASLIWYRERGLACIAKTPEPMKPLSKPNYQGQFLACFTKAAQPDFKGTLEGGRSVVFEAKHTDDDRIKYDRLTGDQIEDLETHYKLGAVAFVLVSFGLQGFYRIPWEVWRDMKQIYGRKYITEKECEKYRVPFVSGVIKMLEYVYKSEEMLNWEAYHDACVVCGKYAGEGAQICPDCKAKGAEL